MQAQIVEFNSRYVVNANPEPAAGAFAEERTGRSESEADTSFSDNAWRAPASGVARLWVVLRDDRGGVGFRSYTLRVR